MNTDPATTPTTKVNKPASARIGESAEATSFKAHMAAAGHRNGKNEQSLLRRVVQQRYQKLFV